MKLERFSDGLLWESKAAWEEAFAKDPTAAFASLSQMQKDFETKLSLFLGKLDPSRPGTLLASCKGALESLLSNLPSEGRLFPTKEEKQKLLLPVCHFLSRAENIRREESSLLVTLSGLEEEAKPLLITAERLFFTGSAAATAETSGDLSTALDALWKEIEQNRATLLQSIERVRLLQEKLTHLDEVFFCDFTQELSKAADLTENAEHASPAAVFRLCGEAKQFLLLISRKIQEASLSGSPAEEETK